METAAGLSSISGMFVEMTDHTQTLNFEGVPVGPVRSERSREMEERKWFSGILRIVRL